MKNHTTRTTRLAFLLLSCLAIPRPGWGSAGTEGASFLDIPVGGRPAAMGSAYTALASDVYAPTWNPAGLGFVDSTQLSGQHLSYLESINYEYLSLVHPLARNRQGGVRRAIGGSIQYLGSGDIQGRDLAGNETGMFSAHYAAYNLSYGQTLTERLAAGVTAKWINAKISDVGANAFALDAGLLYRATSRLTLAGTLTNVGTELKFLNEGDPLPMALRAGAHYQVLPQLGLSGEVAYRRNGLASAHMGAEWKPVQAIALRAGYRTDTVKGLSPMAGLTTGIGIQVKGHELSYAWLPYGELGNTHYFSMNLRFGGARDERRNLIQAPGSLRKHPQVKGQPQTPPDELELMKLLEDTERQPVARKPAAAPRRTSR